MTFLLPLTAILASCTSSAPPAPTCVRHDQVERELHGAPWGVVRVDMLPGVIAPATYIDFAIYPGRHSIGKVCSDLDISLIAPRPPQFGLCPINTTDPSSWTSGCDAYSEGLFAH